MLNPILSNTPAYRAAEKTNQSQGNQEAALSAAGNPAEAIAQGAIPGVQQTAESGTDNKNSSNEKNNKNNFDSYDCQTCKSRKYTDGSNDPGVSFKTPTAVSPEKATAAVRSHEQEHVTREQAAAQREDRKVVSQSVTYHSAICPECGSVYTSGGTTRTVTKGQVEKTYGLSNEANEEKGQNMDMTA